MTVGTDDPRDHASDHEDLGSHDDTAFSALLEDDAADLYDHAPCGYLTTLLDGEIAKINATLLGWLGYRHEDLVGRRRLTDLLTVGGKLYHETHYVPLLRMQGEVREIALELVAADGHRLPVLINAKVKTNVDGQPMLTRITVFDARQRRAYERELLRARDEADRQRAAAENERARLQRLTATLQRTLLPPVLPVVPGLRTAAHYHVATSEDLGGDFYDLFPLTANWWGFFLGDVCGKGPDAAVITSVTRYTLRAAAVYNSDPAAVLANLNEVLLQQSYARDARYCTVTFGLLTPAGDGFDLTVASGGHPPALVIRAGGTVEVLRTPGGQLIGVLPDARVETNSTHLSAGDGMLLYTDGLTEARNGDGSQVGEDHLASVVAGLAGAPADAIIASLAGMIENLGARLSDDAALLALTVPAAQPTEASSR